MHGYPDSGKEKTTKWYTGSITEKTNRSITAKTNATLLDFRFSMSYICQVIHKIDSDRIPRKKKVGTFFFFYFHPRQKPYNRILTFFFPVRRYTFIGVEARLHRWGTLPSSVRKKHMPGEEAKTDIYPTIGELQALIINKYALDKKYSLIFGRIT